MPTWEGFAELTRTVDDDTRFRLAADYHGPDDDPIPVAIMLPRLGRYYAELRADDLEWLRDEAIPYLLEHMKVRP